MKIIRYLLILLYLLLGCTSLVDAQAKTCNLRVNPYEFLSSADRSERISTRSIGEASAVLISSTSDAKQTGELVEMTPFFRNVREGKYLVLVSKDGFKQTSSREFTLNCDHINERKIFCLDVNLARGNSLETETDLNRFTVRGGTPETGTAYYDCMLPLPPSLPPVRKVPPRTISGGVLNGKAISLPRPTYPPAARAVHAGGTVAVQVLIDETGSVVSASAVSGHPLLQAAAESAARAAKFTPTLLLGVPVKVSGVITYNFVP